MSEATATKPILKPRKKPAPAKDAAEVLYPEVKVKLCSGEDAITREQMQTILGWETEEQYRVRLNDPKAKIPANSVILDDLNGNPVACWFNTKNRPFKLEHAKKLAQDILNRNWCLNGETIVISATGQIHSGQHRGIAFVLACQEWAGKNRERYRHQWKTEPVLEAIVVTGISDDPKTVRTLDNVMPRSESDVFYTSPLFAALEPSDKRECSRMLAKAVDFLWLRTGAGDLRGGKVYQTHSQSIDFIDPRHPSLLKCLKTIFSCNAERAISNLKLSPGQCSAVMYLMAAGRTDGDQYRNAEPAPSEKHVDFELHDKAEEFWDALASGDESLLLPIRAALGALVDPDSETGGRTVEKVTVLAKAWACWQDGIPLTYTAHGPVDAEREKGDIGLTYDVDDDGTWQLTDRHGFDGIDLGPTEEKESDPEVSEEEVQRLKLEERKRKADQLLANLNKAKAAKAAAANGSAIPPVKDEVRNSEPSATMAEPGQGKPPSPKLIRPVPKPTKVQQEQTKRAAEADAKMAADKELEAGADGYVPRSPPKPKKS